MQDNKPKAKEILWEIVDWIKVALLGFLAALFIGNFIIVNASVPSGSMMDTIPEKSRIVAFRLSYLMSEPQRFDVVVFWYPDDEKVLFVKRIIGMPGERLDIRDGKVYINGADEPLDDSFVKGVPVGSSGTYNIPEGCYFMMGDNRNNSEDSRLWKNTFLEKSKILGKVIFMYYPTLKSIK
ncbi:MAG: signal peptidase I [Clostridiales bacterium]|jgi:signal peptidase I|nr:signal peptidase I [Clostridiales bacterium]